MAAQTGRDSSNLVVDMVCDVCRVEGFEVEKNVQAGESESHFVGVIASRKKGDKTQKVAFECWEGDRQVNGREVEGFAHRLRSRSEERRVGKESRGRGTRARCNKKKME